MDLHILKFPTARPVAELEVRGLVDQLATFQSMEGVPRAQLEWFTRESEMVTLDIGPVFAPGENFPGLLAILEGKMQAYAIQGGQKKIQQQVGPGDLTGQLPFSRMKASPVYGEATEPLRFLTLTAEKFPQLLCDHFELAGALVHALLDRVRHFTSMHFQNEKLMALGKLSAGITHELNNPASAIVRSAEDLKQTIGSLTHSLTRLGQLQLTPEDVRKLQSIVLKLGEAKPAVLPFGQRMDKEDELTEWADAHSVDSECATTFVDTEISAKDLDELATTISSDRLPALMEWLADTVKIERTADDIAMASRRVSDLVLSLKNYTRMDQDDDMQEVAINEGIHNTLRILQHKVKKNSVDLHAELAAGLPPIMGFPGELTQVWTNLIDNALDAMKAGGDLIVKTESDPNHVIFSVRDSGSGIPPEHLDRIFDPFFTTKDVGEGTGVGLDVVQKVIRLHKGTVQVSSKPGQTEFRVMFPRIGTV